nr:hypothetical protein [uncultured bacterium]
MVHVRTIPTTTIERKNKEGAAHLMNQTRHPRFGAVAVTQRVTV